MADFRDPRDLNSVIWQRYSRHHETARHSPRTIQSYQESCEQLADYAKGADLLKLTRTDIEDFLLEIARLHSESTVQVRFRALRAFFRWCEKEEWIPLSPMHRMPLPHADDTLIPVPDTSDLKKLLAACNADTESATPVERKRLQFEALRDAAMLRLMADCGLRLSETAGLTVEDLSLSTDRVEIRGKGGKHRRVRYSDATAKAITKYLRARSQQPQAHLPGLWLGSGRGRYKGFPLSTSGITQVLRRRCRQAGIVKLHPHQLRHWSASEHLAKGLSGEDAMERYGWSSPAMLRVYAKDTAQRRANDHAAALAIGDSL